MQDLELASTIAAKFHAGQRYGKHDYMYHLNAVAKSLAQENDDRLPIVGVLHDILEDTECTADLLRQLFDKDVVDAVVAITKTCGESYDAYMAKVKANNLARVTKMHDTLCNLTESTLRRDTKRIIKYSKQLQLLAE